MIVLVLSCFAGCANKENKPEEKQVIEFSTLSAEERETYVLKHIEKEYNLKGTLADPVNAMEVYNSDKTHLYYACVDTDNFNKICCWIDEDGTITDTHYTFEMQDNLKALFEPVLSEYFDNYKIYPVVWMQENIQPWSAGQEKEMIAKETSMFIEVYMFIEYGDEEKFKEACANNFDGKLNFANGALNTELVVDLDKLDLKGKTMREYDYGFGFAKDDVVKTDN
jgi:hypothetical protein